MMFIARDRHMRVSISAQPGLAEQGKEQTYKVSESYWSAAGGFLMSCFHSLNI